MLIVIKLIFLVKSYQTSSVASVSICAFPVHEQETSMQSVNMFGSVYSMILSTSNFEYASALQMSKNDILLLFERSSDFINFSCLSKVHFHQPVPLKFVKTMLKYFPFVRFISSMESLFKGSHTAWTTKRSVIVYDEIEDRVHKE